MMRKSCSEYNLKLTYPGFKQGTDNIKRNISRGDRYYVSFSPGHMTEALMEAEQSGVALVLGHRSGQGADSHRP